MQKATFIFLISSILCVTFSFCSHHSNSKQLESWTGEYVYDEEPIKANAGYNMVMTWGLSINKKNDTCQGVLEVNGQQTFMKILTDISGDTNSIALIYNKPIDGAADQLKKGDTLFYLSKSGAKLKTTWVDLEPRLTENSPKECHCFELAKKTNN